MVKSKPILLCIFLFILPFVLTVFTSGEADAQNDEFVCFVYHRFGDDRYPSTNISLETFRAQLTFLKDEGYWVVTLGEAIQKLQSGDGVPDKTVVLTVDDGYASFLTGAMPLLKEFGYRATLFINTESVGGRTYLNWEELKQIQADGIEIGNHSDTHAYFLNMGKEEGLFSFIVDVKTAQQKIKTELGFEPTLFSYPFGEYTPQMKLAIKKMGFRAAVAQNSGVVYRGSDLQALPRFPMGGPYATLEGFREKIKMRALRVRQKMPDSVLLHNENPPSLELVMNAQDVNLDLLQCFVQGQSECEIIKKEDGRYVVRAHDPLEKRRVLYTVTAPSLNGEDWHWFSHVWVLPAHAEE